MTTRAWVGFSVLMMVFGFIFGWGVSTLTIDHRYTRALIERNEAVSDYYALMSDRIIEPNKTKKGNNDVQKKN